MKDYRVVSPAEIEDRLRPHRQTWGDQLRELGETLIGFGDAMKGDDDILGVLLGESLAMQLPALPRHIREVFLEHLSDEAAAGYRADLLYLDSRPLPGEAVQAREGMAT